jgi:hypothetical protein
MTRQQRTSPSFATGRLLPLTVALVVLGLLVIGVFESGVLDSGRNGGERASESWAYRSAEYEQAVSKAIAWVDRLHIDPVALREHGIKGKKKLAEAIAVYSLVLRYEDDPDDVRRFRSRILELAATTDRPDYHNMGTCDAKEFKQDSMSYLRVMWLLKRAGLDTSGYLDALQSAKERFDAHISERGAWQRAMFARYYDDFGLEKPPALSAHQLDSGVVAARLPVEQYDRFRAYQLTHEIFVAFHYGSAADQTTFTPQDLAYLAGVLPPLIDRNIELGDADLLSELVTSMALLGLRVHPATKRGVDYLLEHQNADGTWGDYEAERARMGDLVDQHLYLHTTVAAVQALLEAYERSPRPSASR